MRKFRFAGVSKVDGRVALRASNRDNYDEILHRDKNTGIKIVKLDKPMTKDQIAELLARRKEFRTPQILAVLRKRIGEGEQPVRKAVKKKAVAKKAPAAEQAAA